MNALYFARSPPSGRARANRRCRDIHAASGAIWCSRPTRFVGGAFLGRDAATRLTRRHCGWEPLRSCRQRSGPRVSPLPSRSRNSRRQARKPSRVAWRRCARPMVACCWVAITVHTTGPVTISITAFGYARTANMVVAEAEGAGDLGRRHRHDRRCAPGFSGFFLLVRRDSGKDERWQSIMAAGDQLIRAILAAQPSQCHAQSAAAACIGAMESPMPIRGLPRYALRPASRRHEVVRVPM